MYVYIIFMAGEVGGGFHTASEGPTSIDFNVKKWPIQCILHHQGWVQIRIRICICIQIRKYLYLYLYLKNTKLAYLYLYLNDVFECIWKIFFKYSSNFKRILAELNNISSVACSVLQPTNWIMTHSHCNVKFLITAWIYNTNDWDKLLTMALFKFVLPDLCLL